MIITASRLSVARKRKGLTITALAKAADMSPTSLSKYENKHGVDATPQTLAKLAEKLDVTVDFLTAPEFEELEEKAVSFRAMSKMTARQRDEGLASGRIAITIADWLDAQFHLPEVNVPTLSNYEPENAAEVLRARWGLGEAPIKNLLHLMEMHGVRVFSLPGGGKEIDAFSLWWRKTAPFVMLSTAKSAERQRFDLAHELGHLVMHAEEGSPEGPAAEAQANAFASAFLMPRAGMLAARLTNASMERVLEVKSEWGVSAMALAHRANGLGLLTEWGYSHMCRRLSSLGYRRGEPGGQDPERSQLLRKALQAWRDEQRTLDAVAQELGLSAEEFNSYVFSLGLIKLAGGAQASASGRANLRSV